MTPRMLFHVTVNGDENAVIRLRYRANELIWRTSCYCIAEICYFMPGFGEDSTNGIANTLI